MKAVHFASVLIIAAALALWACQPGSGHGALAGTLEHAAGTMMR